MSPQARIKQSGVPVSAVGNGKGNSQSFAPRPERTAGAGLPAPAQTAAQSEEARVFTSISQYPGSETPDPTATLLSSGDLEMVASDRNGITTATFDPTGTLTQLTITVDGEVKELDEEDIASVVRRMDVFRPPVAGVQKLDPFNVFGYSGVGTNTVDKMPKSRSAARNALNNRRGEPRDGVRAVYLNSANFPENPEVWGPDDGRPLLVIAEHGLETLRVMGGNVIVYAGSSWGNSVEAAGSSQVTVICAVGKKVTTRAQDQSTVTVIPGSGSWGLKSTGGPDARTIIEDVGTEHSNEVFGFGDRSW